MADPSPEELLMPLSKRVIEAGVYTKTWSRADFSARVADAIKPRKPKGQWFLW